MSRADGRRRAGAGLAALAALAAAGLSVVASAEVDAAPAAVLAPFPAAPPGPAGGSRLPASLDDDEVVTVDLDRGGRIEAITSDITLKLAGEGDFEVRLPGPVDSVTDRGGDTPPGLQGGQVVFMGFLNDAAEVAYARARLDPARYASRLPLSVRLADRPAGRAASSGSGSRGGSVIETDIDLTNQTGRAGTFIAGEAAGVAGRAALATTLDTLRNLPELYSPELDIAHSFPVVPAIPLSDGAPVAATVFVPLKVTVTAQLGAGDAVLDPGGGSLQATAGGPQAVWTFWLPADTRSAGTHRLRLRSRTASGRPPAVEVYASPLPLPGALFAPPGGGPWGPVLAAGGPTANLVLLAQAGRASLSRLSDLPPPVSRPGPGPEQALYDYVLGPAGPAAAAAPPPAPHPQPVALTLAGLGVLLIAANAWWAWSRH